MNRAQAAVVEGAVLVSRLHMLPPEKIDTEMKYLQIAIDKTAEATEHEAWGWLREAVDAHRAKAVLSRRRAAPRRLAPSRGEATAASKGGRARLQQGVARGERRGR